MKTEPRIESYKKAFEKFRKILQEPETEIHRDASLKRFELCFELSWKNLQEFLKDKGLLCRSPKDCFKEATARNDAFSRRHASQAWSLPSVRNKQHSFKPCSCPNCRSNHQIPKVAKRLRLYNTAPRVPSRLRIHPRNRSATARV